MKLRKIATTLLAVTMIISLVGCGGKTASSTDRATNTNTAGTENTGATDAGSNTDEGKADAGNEGGEDQQKEVNVEFPINKLLESLTLGDEQLTSESTYQHYADMMGAEYYGADITADFVFHQENRRFTLSGSETYEVGCFYYDGGDVVYGVNIYAGDGIDAYSEIAFDLDGSFSSASTVVDDWAGQDITTLECFSAFINENKINSMVDFIKAMGIDKLDSNFVTTAEAAMSGQSASCKNTFTSEYGPVELSITSFTFNPDFPTGYLSMKFTNGSAPVKGISFVESYYGSFFDNSKHHSVSLSAGEVL